MYLQPTLQLRVRPQFTLLFSIAALIVLYSLPASVQWLPKAAPPSAAKQPNLSRLPLSFEPNVGQAGSAVRYMAHAAGGTLYFFASEVDLALSASGDRSAQRAVARMAFQGANSEASIETGATQQGRVNYYLGNNDKSWRTGVPTYAGVTYNNLYNGITLNYEGNGGRLKGTYLVAAGANPAQIRWQYSNAGTVSVDGTGNLQVTLQGSTQTLTEEAPVAWQEIDGNRVPVQVSYGVEANGVIGFLVGSYSSAYPLQIDPTLTYSSFFGGTNGDTITGVGVDAGGNIYVAGYTDSTDLPTQNPVQPNLRGADDFFISKFTPDGSALLYSTYLGGSSEEEANKLAVDPSGNAYVAGFTESNDFPVLNAVQPTFGGYYDGAVAKLNTSGSLVYSTYLGGGGGANGEDWANGIAADAEGNAYVTGLTWSTDFPTANALQPNLNGVADAFVTKINPTGSALVYSTFLGGSSYEAGMAIAVDSAGSAYVTGRTDSTDFPTQNPIQPAQGGGEFTSDAFVTKINPAGSALVYSTYLGGSDNEPMYKAGIAVDGQGNVYVTGSTYSTDFPTVNAFQGSPAGNEETYLTKVNAAGTAWVYSTYFGGSVWDTGQAVAVDGAGDAYIAGNTTSPDLPMVDAIQGTYGGGMGGGDAYIAAFTPDGTNLLYSTYLGGSSVDDAYGLATDGSGNLFVGGYTGSTDFPIRPNAYQGSLRGSTDGFLAEINYVPAVTPTGTPPTATPRPPTSTRTPTETNTPTVTYTPNPCGIEWNVVPSTADSVYQDISALSDDDIWAVGRDLGGTSNDSTISHYTNGAWNLVSHPNPGAVDNWLYGVSAAASNDVWAVGSYAITTTNSFPLALHWDGQSWSQSDVPVLPQGGGNYVRNILNAVTATAQDDAWAVGTSYTDGKYKAVVFHWDGTAWTLANAFDVPNHDSSLQGVVEIAPDDIWAVGWSGEYGYNNSDSSLTVHWNGTAWSVVSSPNPGGAGNFSTLYNVTAVSSNDVYAVGSWSDYDHNLNDRTFILHWDGSAWTQQDSPSVGNGNDELYDVTAISADDIWAVGSSIDDYNVGIKNSLTEHWNGTAWNVVSSPNRGTFDNVLYGAVALSSSDVWAAGYTRSSDYNSYTLRYFDACVTPAPTGTGTPPTATPRPPTSTNTPTATSTSTPSPTPTVCGLAYPIVEGFESGDTGSFVSSVATCVPGGCGWTGATDRVHSGTYSVHAPDLGNITDQRLTAGTSFEVPSLIVSATLTFWQSYMLDQGFDGGVLEVSTDGGTTWNDAGANITEGGYTGLLSSASGNPIGGRNAWTGSSGSDFVHVTVDLAPYAGNSVLFRFRMGTDISVGHMGWWIDDVRVTVVTSCGGATATDTAVAVTETPGTPQAPTETSIAGTPAATGTPSPEPTSDATPETIFTDVPPGSTFYAPITCMARSGYVSGYADGTFRPNNLLTRGQLAKLVANVSQMPLHSTGQTFADVRPGSTFYRYIESISSAGYIQGYPCGGSGEPCDSQHRPYFRPGNNATRGQLSKIVANAAHLTDGIGGGALGQPIFADLAQGSTFYMYGQLLAGRNYMSGYACGGGGEPCDSQHRPYFRPGNNATRGQATKILANSFYVDCAP